MSFGLSIYIANESSENIELDVQLSNPSSTDITLQVVSNDITATSKFAPTQLLKAAIFVQNLATFVDFNSIDST